MKAIIAAAGGAAHLAGVVAAHTTLPVLGVPMPSKHLQGLDSLLSTVQMPKGIPVATFAIGEAGAAQRGALRRGAPGPVGCGHGEEAVGLPRQADGIRPQGVAAQAVNPEVRRAAEILRAGGLVAFPTETVYGLGADASSDEGHGAPVRGQGPPRRPSGDRSSAIPSNAHSPGRATFRRRPAFSPNGSGPARSR